jgi:hypothetical protein
MRTVGFDNVEVDPIGYARFYKLAGLSWTNFVAFDPLVLDRHDGWENGIVSGDQGAFNGNGLIASVSAKTGDFDLDSVYLTAAKAKAQVADVFGYRDGEQVYHQTVTLNSQAPTLVALGFKDVDEVSFEAKHAKAIIFDDMTFSHIDKGSPTLDAATAFGARGPETHTGFATFHQLGGAPLDHPLA